jgi:hypothetical protein
MPRHIPSESRPLVAALARLPYKSLCGAQTRDLGDGEPCSACVRESILKQAAPSWDVDMNDIHSDGAKPFRELTASEAIKQAEGFCNRDGFLSQDDYQHLLSKLDPKLHYPFRMGLIGHAIHIRTGSVNVVDRVEPGSLGDSGSDNVNGITSLPGMPQPEMNGSPFGTTEFDHNKPRRTEGELEIDSEIGNNLTDLTVASLSGFYDRHVAKINDAISSELSQQQRYETYAGTLRVAGRQDLSACLDDLSKLKTASIQKLIAYLRGVDGHLNCEVQASVRFSPSDPLVVDKVLAELWKHESDGFEHLIHAKSQGIDNDFSQELYRVARLAKKQAGGVVPLPSEPFPSNAKMWADSYHNENAFEGLDKMGDEEDPTLDYCFNCKHPVETKDIVACELCDSGKQAVYPTPACFNCSGSGKLALCACGQAFHVESEYRPIQRWAAWRKKSDAVKRITRFADIPVHIEYNAGEVKTYSNGNSRKYNCPYGFIPGTVGADNEPLDVFLGSYPAHKAYIVTQMKPDGTYDEDKVLLGFKDASTAEAMYRSHHPKNAISQFGGMREMGLEDFNDQFVKPEREDAYKPKLVMKQMPVEADHGVGDSDGCETGKPVGGHGLALKDAIKSDPKVKNFVKMVLDPAALGSLATSKPDFPLAGMKGAPAMPDGIMTLGDVVKAMAEAKAPPIEKKVRQAPKVKQSGNKSVDALQSSVAKAITGEKADLTAAKADPVTGAVATQIEKMLNNPEMAEKTRDLLSNLLAKGGPVESPAKEPAKSKSPADPKAPKPAPTKPKPSPTGLSNVDTSSAISPVEEAWKREASALTDAWNQMWKLISGGDSSNVNTFKGSKQADMPVGVQPEEQFDTPVTGPLSNNGVDGKDDELICINATLDSELSEWMHSLYPSQL